MQPGETDPSLQTALEKESQEKEPKRGANVIIRNFWQRHSQKASGEVYASTGSGISTSSISPGGLERASLLGSNIPGAKHGVKGYKTEIVRTEETFNAIMEGYKAANPETSIRQRIGLREELSPMRVPAYDALYNAKWNANKKALLEQRGLRFEDFSKLSPDEQEEIAEEAEEPVIREWLDDPHSDMAQAFPPRIQASRFAVLFNRRHERMAEKLNSGSEIDLFHNTHKTATEPFLTSGVLVRQSNGKHITKLEEIGGSLKILDNWESEVKTDDERSPTTEITIRGEKYALDKNILEELVKDGLEQQELRRELKAKNSPQ